MRALLMIASGSHGVPHPGASPTMVAGTPVDLDLASGGVWVVGVEAHQPGRGLEDVEHAAGYPPMQGADDLLVLLDGVAVGTVSKAAAQPILGPPFENGLEAEGGERVAQRLLRRGAPVGAISRPISRPARSTSRRRLARGGIARASQRASSP